MRYSTGPTLDWARELKASSNLSMCEDGVARLMLSPMLPRAIGLLKPTSYEQIATSVPDLPAGTMMVELNWMGAIFLNRIKRLNEANISAREIDRCVLLGDSEAALRRLLIHEKQFGVSIRTLCIRFGLQNITGSFQNSGSLVPSIRRRKPLLIAYIIGLLNVLYEPRTSVKSCASEIDDLLPAEEAKYHGLHDLIKLIVTPYRLFSLRNSAETLEYAQRFPLEDQFTVFLEVVRRYLGSITGSDLAMLELLRRLSSVIESPYLRNLTVLAGDQSSETHQPPTHIVAYSSGNFHDAVRLSIEAIDLRPEDFSAHLVLAKAAQYARSEIRASEICACWPSRSPVSRLQSLIETACSSTHVEDVPFDELKKFAYTQPSVEIGHGLEDFLYAFNPYAVLDWPRRPAANPYTSPNNPYVKVSQFLAQERLNREDYECCLEWLGHSRPADGFRYHLNSAMFAFKARNFALCIQELDSVRRSPAFATLVLIDRVKYYQLRILANYRLQNLEDALAAGMAAIKEGILGDNLPLDKIVAPTVSHQNLSPQTLGYLALLRKLMGGSPQEVNHAVESYLAAKGLGLPSELCRSIPDELSVEVLKTCCGADILEWNISIETPQHVATERITICTFLTKKHKAPLPGDQIKIFEKDIQLFTEYLFRKQAVEQLAITRIYVPREAVATFCERELSEDIKLLLSLKELNVHFVDLKSLLAGETNLRELSELQGGDWAGKKFLRIFRAILHTLCWNRHFGLDGHLSMTIRHGTLFGQIRTPFQQCELVTDERVKGEGYEPNLRLGAYLKVDQLLQSRLDAASSALAKSIDSYHEYLRSQRIQIKMGSSHQEGLFDLDFTDAEILALWQNGGSQSSTNNELIEFCIAAILARIDRSLISIQNFVKGEVLDALLSALAVFQRDISEELSNREHLSLIDARVTSCRTMLQNYMSQAASWFSSQKVDELPSFALSMLIRFAIDQEEQLAGKAFGSQAVECRSDVFMAGKYFNSLYHVCQILLRNCIEHSGLPMERVKIIFAFEAGNGSQLFRIACRNTLSSEIDVTARLRHVRALVERAHLDLDPEVVSREGGSGFAKLYRILRGDGFTAAAVNCNQFEPNIISVEVEFKIAY